MNKLTRLITKKPVKTLLFTLALLVVLAIGVTKITLKTGNDTLISNQSDIYKDNEAYQTQFGKDPIILIFDEENLFAPSTLKLMYKMQEDIKSLEGVFSINSPVTVINQIGVKMYQETSSGLGSMATGLLQMSNQLGMLGQQLVANDGSTMPDIDGLAVNMQQLMQAQDQLGTGLVNMFGVLQMMQLTMNGLTVDLDALEGQIENDPLLDAELQLVNAIQANALLLDTNLGQLIMQEGIAVIPPQTTLALGNIVSSLTGLATTLDDQLEAMQTLSTALLTMSTNLGNLSLNLDKMQKNFNVFKPGFPTEDATLEMMVYDQGVLRDNFKGFKVSENKIRMVVVLNGNITDDQIDVISQTLFKRLALEDVDSGVLISGKPILDRSIKSSMMASMKYMMLSAILIMVLILAFIYKVKMRLLPIFMILMAVVATIGIMGWMSIGLTMVSMAVFPVLIGLGIDYFIQFQTRYEEERGKV